MVWAHNKMNRTCKDDPTAWNKEGEGKADRKRDGMIIYQNGQVWGWVKPFERLRTERNGEKWFSDHP